MAIFLPAQKPSWSPAQAAELGTFLATPTGQQLMSVLLYRRPEFPASMDPNVRAVVSGKIEGYEQALIEMQKLTVMYPEDGERE